MAPTQLEWGEPPRGSSILEIKPWQAPPLCPPGPAAVNLTGHGTLSQLCSDHLSFAPNENVLVIRFSSFPSLTTLLYRGGFYDNETQLGTGDLSSQGKEGRIPLWAPQEGWWHAGSQADSQSIYL